MAVMMPHKGEQNPVVCAVDSATVIEHGDNVFQEVDDVRPVGNDANADGTGDLWSTSEGVTQLAAKEKYMGVAQQASRAGDTDPISVCTSGEFLFDCDSDTFELGEYLTFAKTSGNNLENRKVKATLEHELAFAVVSKREAVATTKVWGRITSTVMSGGLHADVGS